MKREPLVQFRSSTGHRGLIFQTLPTNPLKSCVKCFSAPKAYGTPWCPRCMPRHIFKGIIRLGKKVA